MADLNERRIQLSLFVEGQASEAIERIRREYNPAQYALIKCHVTLCREDELVDIETVLHNIHQLPAWQLTLTFGRPIRFAEGKGVMIPALGSQEAFQQLRKDVLKGVLENPRLHQPHLTLIHPRNATCTDELFDFISGCAWPSQLEFRKLSLIEQNKGGPWQSLATF